MDNIYDFIIVGAGTAGSVLANRLSENGKYTVCVLESGRDDARLQPLLPEKSDAPIPQPDDYQWNKYIRCSAVEIGGALHSRGFADWWFFQKQDEDPNSRSIHYNRASTWGGCSSHNQGIVTRNAPHNWSKWEKLGLKSWSYDNIYHFYKLVENRSQLDSNGIPYYDISNECDYSYGSFHPTDYGYNGMLPMMPPHCDKNDRFVITMQNIINDRLCKFDYPTYLVDIDNPDIAHLGGLSFPTYSLADQKGYIVPPGETGHVKFSRYNYSIYGDKGIEYPPEFTKLNKSGLLQFQKMSSANTYLYPALKRENLTIMSQVLVTEVIIENLKAVGVKYLEGWNIYQTGRNPSCERGGYGGTPGDARANAILSGLNGEKTIYARKEVILCAGVYNTPQLLMLSGIGNTRDLKKLGINVKYHLPGVGRHLIDAHELFIFWKTQLPKPNTTVVLAAKSDVNKEYPNFDISFGESTSQNLESLDPFVQRRWISTKNDSAICNTFIRNDFSNILVDDQCAEFKPIWVNPKYVLGSLIEQEEDSYSEGYMKLVSSDPTVPPRIIAKYLSDERDLDAFADVMLRTVFPIVLELGDHGYFESLIDPAPSKILKNNVKRFTCMNDIDVDKLKSWLKDHVGGHHAMGTCKMGLSSDPMVVVGEEGLVHGIEGLRICDASIIPICVRWPYGTLFVIAEKISYDILNMYD